MLVSVLLLLILVAGAGWYFATPKNVWVPENSHFILARPADSLQPDTDFAKSAGRVNHPAIQGPAAVEKTDTLRISSTQNFADLKKYADSTGNTLVLVPEKPGNNRFAAISITVRSARPGDTVLIKNLRLTGFQTGIDIHLPISLKAENLVFENTTLPFRNLFKPDEKHASILLMNTAK